MHTDVLIDHATKPPIGSAGDAATAPRSPSKHRPRRRDERSKRFRALSELPATDRKILEELKGKPWGLRHKVIAANTGISFWTAYDALHRLELEGRIVRTVRTWGARFALADEAAPLIGTVWRETPAFEFAQ